MRMPFKSGVLALALLAMSAGGASAQLIHDGNLFFNDNADGTLVGQFSGARSAPLTAGPVPPAG